MGGKQRRGWISYLTACGIAALGIGLLTDGAAVAEGIRRGLEMSGNLLIPSLFPFMVLAVFLSETEYARILAIPLRPITTKWFRLPADLGSVVLLSLVGGYPVGAKMIAGLLEQGRVEKATAERMLCFCVNAGPPFLIAAVGSGMFLDVRAGWILFATQTAATAIIGGIASARVPRVSKHTKTMPYPYNGTTALVLAVEGATGAMLAMCAFAILFSGLQSMLLSGEGVEKAAAVFSWEKELLQTILCGCMEVTTGCRAAADIGGAVGFALASGFLSFGGLSVLFQVAACLEGQPLRLRPLLLAKIAHAALSTAMALPLYLHFCQYSAAFAGDSVPVGTDMHTTLISVCLLGMCAIFTLSLDEMLPQKTKRDKKDEKRVDKRKKA